MYVDEIEPGEQFRLTEPGFGIDTNTVITMYDSPAIDDGELETSIGTMFYSGNVPVEMVAE